MARAIIGGLTPPGFRDDVHRRVKFEDARSDPYWVVQLMEKMSQKKWTAINEYQRGARFSRRGGWKQSSGDGRGSYPRGGAHGLGSSGRSIKQGCWSCGSIDHKKNNLPTREAKATKDGREGASGRWPSGSRVSSGSSRPAGSFGGVVHPGTARTHWKQRQLKPPAFSTRSRNNTW